MSNWYKMILYPDKRSHKTRIVLSLTYMCVCINIYNRQGVNKITTIFEVMRKMYFVAVIYSPENKW